MQEEKISKYCLNYKKTKMVLDEQPNSTLKEEKSRKTKDLMTGFD